MDDDKLAPFEQEPSACPFVALEDDRDRRSDSPDYRHRCFASLNPEPRAFPHQERYCLSRGFTDCPIFLDWAKREAASVVPGRRRPPAASGAGVAAVSAGAATAAGAAAAGAMASRDDAGDGTVSGESRDAEVPAFLTGRGRPAPRIEDAQVPPDPEEGLWGPAEPRHRPGAPVSATARANSSRPDWEPTMREERYPRIKHRSGFNAGPLVALLAVIVVAALMFMFVPSLLPKASAPTPTPTVKQTATPEPTPTAVPTPTATSYTIKPGDTLSGIAAKFGVSIDEIKAANPQIANVDDIHDGDTITIPVPGGAGANPSASTTP